MNKPVAWTDGQGGFYDNEDYEECKKHNIYDDLIPLYTHPVKELTNEEIFEIAFEQYGHSAGLYGNHIGFAKAILRKAQEK